MKLELIIFGLTGLYIYNTFYNNKLSKYVMSCKKYFQMAGIAFAAYSLYMMIRKNPTDTKNMILYANQAVKHLPIDKSAMDMLTPIFDFTSGQSFMDQGNGFADTMNRNLYGGEYQPSIFSQQQQGGTSIGNKRPVKRSVSETKKKYVAYTQDWKCGACDAKLTHTFEIDHKIRLEHGGQNDASNLVALCRECHGQKTASENM
jgi:hypothetical protein